MIIVRKRRHGLEFEFPTIPDESGAPQRIYLGGEFANDEVQPIDLPDQEVDELGLPGGSR